MLITPTMITMANLSAVPTMTTMPVKPATPNIWLTVAFINIAVNQNMGIQQPSLHKSCFFPKLYTFETRLIILD